MTIEYCYRISLDHAGYIKDRSKDGDNDRGIGWMAEFVNPDDGLNWHSLKHDLIVLVDTRGRIFVGGQKTQLLTSGAYPDFGRHYIKWGRAKLYQWTDDTILHLMDHNQYRSRSEREQQVRDRNLGVLGWLAGWL